MELKLVKLITLELEMFPITEEINKMQRYIILFGFRVNEKSDYIEDTFFIEQLSTGTVFNVSGSASKVLSLVRSLGASNIQFDVMDLHELKVSE